MAGIGWWDETGVNKGLFYDRTGSATVTINGCDTIGTHREFETDYLKDAGDWTDIDSKGHLLHSCTGNIVGGSQGDVNTPHRHWASMGRSKTAMVEIKGGHILGNVYGGSEQGVVTGNTKVIVSDGTIGIVINPGTDSAYSFGSVHGGGFGSNDRTTSDNDSSKIAVRVAGYVYGNTN